MSARAGTFLAGRELGPFSYLLGYGCIMIAVANFSRIERYFVAPHAQKYVENRIQREQAETRKLELAKQVQH